MIDVQNPPAPAPGAPDPAPAPAAHESFSFAAARRTPPEVRIAALGHQIPARDALNDAARSIAVMRALFAAGDDRTALWHAREALRAIDRAGRHLKVVEQMTAGMA
jgi:thiamine monophosphate synthase